MDKGVDPLDDLLSVQPAHVHKKPKLLLKVVREAYPIGVPALILKSHTDRLAIAGRYQFHLGTPDSILRRICSWLLTNQIEGVLEMLISDLWKRHGREDVALFALILANIHTIDDSKAWEIFNGVLSSSEAVEGLLLVIEEMFRAKRERPTSKVVLQWCESGGIHSQFALIVYHAWWIRNQREDIENDLVHALNTIKCSEEDSLVGRSRGQLLEGSEAIM